jgi:TPR repeat protein
VPSMLAIARMYDPATFKPGQGPVAKADADEASTWYEQAANKGSVEAMQRLSTLLKDPNVTRPDAAERATFWQLKAEAAAKSGTAPAAGSPTGASP